ncbi:hypothetical protein Tco_1314204 [Tanacetum coccineum]
MHNNIMTAGSRDRPLMLATGRYPQWQLRFLRYIDTRLNGDALRKCILEGPYQPTTVIILAVPATKNSPAVPARTTVEPLLTMSHINKAHYESDDEAIHLLLTGIGDEIYSTVDACKATHEMFVTIVKQQHDLDTVSYHKLFDVLKQYQKEVNEICAKRITNNTNPLALVAAAQQYLDPYYQAPKSHKTYAPTSKASPQTRSHASTKFKGKEIAKPITPLSESAFEENIDPEQAQRDKEMQKNLELVAKYFKTIYKPSNNNLRTSLNSRNKNVDTTPRYKNDNQTRQFGNQRTVTVAGARETVGTQEVPTADSGTNIEPLEHVHNDAEYNVFANVRHHSEQPESNFNTCLVEKEDSNVTPDSPDMCDNDIQTDQNADDERATLANLIANLKLDVDENKKIQKQLKKANASLSQELKECKSILAETSKTLRESNSIRDSCIVALQNKQTEFERYKALNDRTVDYDKLERLVKEKTKVITDLEIKEEKDINKMISMEKQLKFLNEIVYKRNQSIQTIYMLAPKSLTFNGRPTFANPMYLKKAQYEKPCLYEIPNDQSDPANRLVPDREETLTLEKESRSKLNKDLVRPYDYTKLNSLYEIFKLASQEYNEQLAHANEVRKKMWRKSFVKIKPNIFKNIGYLPVSKSTSKSRQAYNVMTNNINHFRELVDQAWEKHSHNHFRAPTALDMEVLIKTCLMPLAIKTQNDSFTFVHELKQEMHVDLKYVESLENEIDELEFDKAEFSNKLQCLYLHKVKECECLAQKLLKQTESVSQDVYTELLRSFAKLEKHSIYLELALQQCQEQMQNNTVCKEKASNLFQKERVIHKTSVSRPQLRSNQMKDKVVPNNSQVKDKKTEVEDHPRISSISNKTKSVTASNDSLKSRTSNVNAVCATCGKCVFNSNHDACISKYLNDVNARTKKPKVVLISTSKPKSQANKSVATPPMKIVASESTIQKSKSYYRMLYEKTSKAWKWWIEQQCPSGYKWVPNTKTTWVPKVRNENV